MSLSTAAKKLAIKTGAAVAVFCLIFFGLILPKFFHVRALSQEVKKTLAVNQRLQAEILTAKQSGDRLDEIKTELARFRSRALHQEDLIRVLNDFGFLAQKAGLKVASLRALDEPCAISGEPFKEDEFELQHVIMSIKTEGKFQDVLEYLHKLDQLSYLTAVEAVSLKNPVVDALAGGEDPKLSAEMTVAVLMRGAEIKRNESPGGRS